MESREMFMAALLYLVDTKKQITRKEISSLSGIAPQTLSNVLRGHKEAGLSIQERVAKACGYSLLDFLIVGRDVLEERAPGEARRQESTQDSRGQREGDIFSEAKDATVTNAMGAMTQLIEKHNHLEWKLRFWRTIFEAIADPVCIIKDGIVMMQNQKSKAWGILAGEPLCNNCIDGLCDKLCQGDVCAIKEAQRHGVVAKRFKNTPWGQAVITCSPMILDGQEYYIVTSTLIEEVTVRGIPVGGNNNNEHKAI